MKPGHTTSEFWLTSACVLGIGTLSVFGLVDPKWTAAGMSLPTLLYTFLRVLLKSKQS